MKKYIITEELVQKIGTFLMNCPMSQVEPLVIAIRTELKLFTDDHPVEKKGN